MRRNRVFAVDGNGLFSARGMTGYGAYMEIGALFAIAVAADASGLLPFPLLELRPHPFWLPVVLCSANYGLAPGIVCVVVAIALDYGFGWSPPAAHTDYYEYLLTNLEVPILWLVTSAILGQIADRHIIEKARLREAIGEHRAGEHSAWEQVQALRSEIAGLQHARAVAGGPAAGQVLDLFQELLSVPVQDLEHRFANVLQRLIGARGVSIFWFDGKCGPMERSAGPAGLPPAIKGALLARSQDSRSNILICSRPSDAECLGGQAVIAAALTNLDRQVAGVVLIRECDPDCLGPSAQSALGLACFIVGCRTVRPRPQGPSVMAWTHDERPIVLSPLAPDPAPDLARGNAPGDRP